MFISDTKDLILATRALNASNSPSEVCYKVSLQHGYMFMDAAWST